MSVCVNDRLINEDSGDGSRVMVELMLSETRKSNMVIPLDDCPHLPQSGQSRLVTCSRNKIRYT